MMSLFLLFFFYFPKEKLMNLKRSHDQTKLVERFECDYMWFMGSMAIRTPAPAGAKVKMKMSIINDHDDDDEWQAISKAWIQSRFNLILEFLSLEISRCVHTCNLHTCLLLYLRWNHVANCMMNRFPINIDNASQNKIEMIVVDFGFFFSWWISCLLA